MVGWVGHWIWEKESSALIDWIRCAIKVHSIHYFNNVSPVTSSDYDQIKFLQAVTFLHSLIQVTCFFYWITRTLYVSCLKTTWFAFIFLFMAGTDDRSFRSFAQCWCLRKRQFTFSLMRHASVPYSECLPEGMWFSCKHTHRRSRSRLKMTDVSQ